MWCSLYYKSSLKLYFQQSSCNAPMYPYHAALAPFLLVGLDVMAPLTNCTIFTYSRCKAVGLIWIHLQLYVTTKCMQYRYTRSTTVYTVCPLVGIGTPHTPSSASECAARGWGGGGVAIRTSREKAFFFFLIIY
jgi:hypothetical protein